MIRQPIICVMGHIDHGKTSLLDRIRNSTIAAREAGGITQHIGASEVPIDVINRICGDMMQKTGSKMLIPGLLFIDTPGHDAFTNLRKRGGSAADMAILVIDIMKGFEPQTIEAIEILREYKTPFIVAANKIDLITGWRNTKSNSIADALKGQNAQVVQTLDEKMYELIGKMSELGFSSERYDRITEFKSEIAIIPLSAKTGEGLAELLMLVAGLSQRFLGKRLDIGENDPGKGSILEKKEVKGLGITIDVILYDGKLQINDTIAFATAAGVATAKIKALLKPKPLHEIRESSSKFYYVNEVGAACGVKISGTGLDDALPGSPVLKVANSNYHEEINTEIGDVFMTDKTGLILKADSIGSIEAISKLLKITGINISKKSLGMVNKRDILDAFAMRGLDPRGAVILAFNVSVDHEAMETAAQSGIKIISSNIIYKLIDDYKQFVGDMQRVTKEGIEKDAVYPAEISILPNSCFRASHPAIFGINVDEGRIRPGYVVMSETGTIIGKIKGIQNDKNALQEAKKGESVAISIEGPTFGRQIRDGQRLYTRVRDADEYTFKTNPDMLTPEEAKLLSQIVEIKRNAKAPGEIIVA